MTARQLIALILIMVAVYLLMADVPLRREEHEAAQEAKPEADTRETQQERNARYSK